MRRLLSFIITIAVGTSLLGCSVLNSENKVKVIPQPKVQETSIAGIDFLHNGSLCDITDDGREILFGWNEEMNTDLYQPDSFLYTMNTGSRSLKKITTLEGVVNYEAKYSPNGQKIAVSALSKDRVRTLPCFIMDLKNMTVDQLIPDNPGLMTEGTKIDWSSDGKSFAVTGWDGKGDKIVLFDSKGNQTAYLNEKRCYNPILNQTMFFNSRNLDFSTDSSLVFISENTIAVNSINQPLESSKKIAKGTFFSISPDRRYIAYINETDVQGKFNIKVDLLGEDLTLLYTAADFDIISVSPVFAWSCDSKYITYYSHNSIWNLSIETKAVKQLITNMGRVNKILWAGNNSFVFDTLEEESPGRKIYHVKFDNYVNAPNESLDREDLSLLNRRLKKLQEDAARQYREDIISINASSTLEGSYQAENLIDRRLNTAWVEGVPGLGEGQYIEIGLNDIALNSVGIVNGYRKSDYIYYANSRLKKVKIELETVIKNTGTGAIETTENMEKVVSVEDRVYNTGYYMDHADLLLCHSDLNPVDDNQIRLVRKIRLTILESYKGSKYEDTCISEVIILGKSINR